jgi:hypothetical protein
MADEWKWYWGYGREPERYHGSFATSEEAVEAAKAAAQVEHTSEMTVVRGRPMPLTDDFFDADRVLDEWHDRNEELQDEDGELAMKPSFEQKHELEAMLNAAFKAWRAKHELGRAWAMDTVDEIVITIMNENTQ